jgi:hypothetical protein
MKRIISTLFVLALALSVGLLTVPVLAASGPYYGWWAASDPTSGTAAWSTAQSHSASTSAHLIAIKAKSPNDYHEVYVANPTGVDSLADLTSVEFWYYCPTGSNERMPLIDVWLDMNGSYNPNPPPSGDDEWLLGMIADVTVRDTWVHVTQANIQWVRATGGAIYGYGAAGLTAALAALGDKPILAIGVETGGPGTYISGRSSDQEFYIDDLAINGINYDFEVKTSQTGTATGTGTASFTPSTGSITGLTAVAEGSLPGAALATKPGNFPDGFFSFNITGLQLGETVYVTITLPSNYAPTQYWKYHASEGGWKQIPMTNLGPSQIKITLQDGGLGDDDLTQNGVIVDQGGPTGYPVGWETYPISRARVLAPWIALIVAIAAGASLLVIRRRRTQS